MTKDKDMLETEDQEELVIITDEAGNETYYREEMVIPVDTVLIARMEFDADGEPIYLDPTDEEFEEARKAYDAIMDEMEEK